MATVEMKPVEQYLENTDAERCAEYGKHYQVSNGKQIEWNTKGNVWTKKSE